MKLTKKTIGPVVATILLLVIVVVSVVGFSTWYSTYSSDLQTKSEKQSAGSSILKLEALNVKDSMNFLYIKNPSTLYVEINRVELNGNLCDLVGSNVLPTDSINIIELGTNCSVSKGIKADIAVFTNFGIYSGEYIAK